MARWKARVDFFLTVIELLFLSLAVDALQGKTHQNSLLVGGMSQMSQNFRGNEYFLVSRKLGTFCYLTVQTARCYVQSF